MLEQVRFLIGQGFTGLPGLWLARHRTDPRYANDPEFWATIGALHLAEGQGDLAQAAFEVAALAHARLGYN